MINCEVVLLSRKIGFDLLFVAILVIASFALITNGKTWTPFLFIAPVYLLFFRGVKDKFTAVKIGTLLVGHIIFYLMSLGWMSSYVWIFSALMLINILEAGSLDLKRKNYWLFGLALGLALSFMNFSIVWAEDIIVTSGSYFLAWAILYTVWNFLFILKNFKKEVAFFHLPMLITPFIVMALTSDEGGWLLVRSYSLLIGLSFQEFVGEKVKQRFRYSKPALV